MSDENFKGGNVVLVRMLTKLMLMIIMLSCRNLKFLSLMVHSTIGQPSVFTTMVIDKKSLTDGQRLQYLKPNVFNEAEDIVAEYKITDANFPAAWDALEERYENKQLQVNAHLSTLFDQDVMASENVESLRLLLRTTQKCLRSLKSLGGSVETWDWLLIHMTVIRLDPTTRRYWELTHTSKEVPTSQKLITALENRLS